MLIVGKLALRPISVGGSQRGLDLLPADVVLGQRCRINLDSNCRTRGPLNLNLSDSRNLRDLLIQYGIRYVVDLASFFDARSQGKNHDRLVGWVVLPISRIVGQVRGQLSTRSVDRSLNVAGGSVDVAIQIELHRDLRLAGVAARRQFS